MNWKWLFCKHKEITFVRNVYGDEINELGCRSIWRCCRCQDLLFKKELHEQ